MMTVRKVSVHGGHSGQFCSHARDSLAAIVETYAAQGFAWVGLTEHMPPLHDGFLYQEEKDAGLDAAAVRGRFERYFEEARRCRELFRDRIEVLVGFESEAYPGALEYARQLAARHRPDYIVGSLHHIGDIAFDGGPAEYARVLQTAGGAQALYCSYFDRQYDLIQALRPAVVGHFDLIRIFDPDYPRHLQLPAVAGRIRRNLEAIARLNLILDFNLAALRKGASEPYVSGPILSAAHSLGIAVVPGDDSHSTDTVGAGMEEGISILARMGFDLNWRKPANFD